MARPKKYKISQIANFNRIATLCALGLLTESEAARLLDFNKVTFSNIMTEWMISDSGSLKTSDIDLSRLKKLKDMVHS